MKKEKGKGNFIEKPIYPGGITAMRKFIRENLQYPVEALDNKIEGFVLCKYQINYRGEVIAVKVISGIGYGCDEEATRIIKLFKFNVPKTPRKLKVKFLKSIRIKFKLPKKKPEKKMPATSMSVNYTITKAKKEKYSYTINI